jgi:Zn-dependent peptidase ImmA (M78 family)
VLRAEEAKVRQRFSMIHEFKHVLDDPFIEWMYQPSTAKAPKTAPNASVTISRPAF